MESSVVDEVASKSETLSATDINQNEFPKDENWWPKTSNEEWESTNNEGGSGEPIQQRDDRDERNSPILPKTQEFDRKTNGSNFRRERDSNTSLSCRRREKEGNNKVFVQKVQSELDNNFYKLTLERLVLLENASNKRVLVVGTEINEKTYVAPRCCSIKILVDCKLQNFEIASGVYVNDEFPQWHESSQKAEKRGNGGNCVFFKKTITVVSRIPSSEYRTRSYKIETTTSLFIPKDCPPVEIIFGMIKDEKIETTSSAK